jgi:curved DNA-binding protein
MAVKFQDYYQTLGVARTASTAEIQRAYRKLARQYHPDVNKNKDAEQKFKQAAEAYEVLRDPEKRKRYDTLGENWKAGQEFTPPGGWQEAHFGGPHDSRGFTFRTGSADAGDFSDFFDTFFGRAGFGEDAGEALRGGQAGGGRRARRGGRGPGAGGFSAPGQDQEATLEIPLEDAYRGATREITLKALQVQPDGSAAPVTRTYTVKIPPGTTDGSVIRLAGQGGSGAGGAAAGDLLLRIRLSPDARFSLAGDDKHDLQTDLRIAPGEAALGAKVPVRTLDGETLTVTVPPGSQSGQRLRLRGKGLPRRAGGAGDLYARLMIVVPKTLTARERELLTQLQQESKFDPRAE